MCINMLIYFLVRFQIAKNLPLILQLNIRLIQIMAEIYSVPFPMYPMYFQHQEIN